MGDRRQGRRPHRRASGARHARRLRPPRRARREARPRDRARLRDPVLARPPMDPRAPGVVQVAARRDDQVRREPAEALSGHRQRRLRLRGLARPVGGAARCRPLLDRTRRARLPGRQPAHEAAAVLGVAARRGTRGASRHHLPLRGVHAPHDDARARQGRLQPVVHVLHMEERSPRARAIRDGARERDGGLLPAELLRQHPGHPARVPPERRPARVRGPARAGRDALAELRHLLGLRADRERAGAARQRGVPRFGEVRAEAARARRRAAAARAAAERDPACKPGAAAHRQRHVPRDRERVADRLREAKRVRHRARLRQPRRARDKRGAGDRARLARPAAVLYRAGPAERGELRLAHGQELRHARSRRRTRDARSMIQTLQRSEASQPGKWFEADPLWFKRAVFYEIHIRGFYDGNDDGSGDFRGLTEKLDYLQWLGIDCVWLLPMYPSPLRDGGYDIADFYSIHPDYGTVEDFRVFVEQAHQRGIRVVADLVVNHTSADHPWFQEARSDPKSPKRDWYVWSDTDQRYQDARIIFIDTEPSNWTWDPVAG